MEDKRYTPKSNKYILITLSLIFLAAISAAIFQNFQQSSQVVNTPQNSQQISTATKEIPPFVIAFENEVVSLDPIHLNDVFGLRVASQIFEGLSKIDTNNRVVPALASSWESDDSFKNWIFTLRDNITFHNGEPLTVKDVIFSFTRMLAKDAVTKGPLEDIVVGAKAYGKSEEESVSGIEIIAPNKVRFQLTRSDAEFPGRIASPAYSIVPATLVEKAKDEFGDKVVVGTGPFQLESHNGYDITLKRFQRYRGGPGKNMDKVIFRTIKEDQVRLNALENGSIHAMYVTPPLVGALIVPDTTGNQPTLKADYNQFTAISYPVFSTYFVAFNYPDVAPNLRRAITFAIDRQKIVQGVAPHSAVAAAGPIPLACDGWQTRVPVIPPDIGRAKEALNKFFAANPGKKASIDLLVHDLAQAVPIGEIVKAQLEPLGIEVNLHRLSFNTVIDKLTKGDFQAVAIAFEYQYPTPGLILENFYTSRAIPMPNLFHYSEPEVDADVEKLFYQSSQSEILNLAKSIEQRIINDAPAAFLFQANQLVVMTDKIENVQFNGANFPILEQASWK